MDEQLLQERVEVESYKKQISNVAKAVTYHKNDLFLNATRINSALVRMDGDYSQSAKEGISLEVSI